MQRKGQSFWVYMVIAAILILVLLFVFMGLGSTSGSQITKIFGGLKGW